MSFAIVQSKSATGSGAAASISATLDSTPTAPHLIAVMVQGLGGTGPTYTIADNHSPSNTYVQAAHAVLDSDGGGNNQSLDVWLFAPTAAQLNSGFAVTVTPSVSSYMSVTVAEVSFAGSPPTAGTPQSASAGGASTNSIATPALSISVNSLVLYLASQYTATDPIAPAIGSAIYQHTFASGTAIGFLSAYDANVATGVTPSASMPDTANTWAIAGVALAEHPITLTGPTSGTVGSASTNFTLSPSAAMTGVFTPSVSGVTGTFSPATLTFSNSSTPQTFTFTATSAGNGSVSGSFDRGYTTSGGPIGYAVAAGAASTTGATFFAIWRNVSTIWATGQSAAGASQSAAFPLMTNSGFTEFTTTPSGSGAILPSVVLPARHEVVNGGANALLVYPPVGGTVDGGGVNAPYSLSAGSVAIFWLASPLTWKVIA